jgi:hypothetical protein
VELLKAFGLLIVGGGLVFGVTYGLGKFPGLFSKKKKKSCCD